MGVGGSSQILQTSFTAGTYFQLGLDSANFHEGSLCTGSIEFELTSSQPPLEVYIAIHGYENVMWKERRSSGSGKNRRTRIVTIHDSAQTVNQRYLIMKTNESFMPGQYKYPISFQLPAGLPGSFVHSSGFGSNIMTCSSSYVLY